MGWGNIYKRRMKVFKLAFVIYLDYKALQQREKWTSKFKRATLWEKAHERNAKRVLSLMIELEGLWVKLGQYLSTRADVLPGGLYIPSEAVAGLSSFPPLRRGLWNHRERIAQVHRATLRDEQEVVVKVQHEGIKTIILEDLKNAKSIVDWIAWAEPQYDFSPMIDEWCKEAPKELDFNHEAENTRTVSKNLCCKRKSNDKSPAYFVDVWIPDVIQVLTNKSLLKRSHAAYAHQIYVDGFFNGDPHPGNFLVSKEPPYRPILLDFGLTKLLSIPMKQALAKMFLASAEGDHVALLSAFAEMGLRFRLDMPEQVMDVTSVFFRNSTPASEALENVKSLAEQRNKNLKVLQEKMKLNTKEAKRFNPVDAFPGDIVIFSRVLNLLRGLSSAMNVRIVYLDIMRPFAESVLQGNISKGPALNAQWIYDTPVHSGVEAKLRQLLVELGNGDKILGIQVCAYKDGEVIIDTAAGVLGRYDPRPVQPDSLFPVFSVTKGITAGMLHWLVDNGYRPFVIKLQTLGGGMQFPKPQEANRILIKLEGVYPHVLSDEKLDLKGVFWQLDKGRKLKLEENVANVWPQFRSNGKDLIKVHHVLNHTSGLHNALANLTRENPFLMLDWDECLSRIAMSVPETEPGHEQLYHYLSFGWLCGGVIEHASGKKFQEILEEAFIHPLNIEGELC
ncbi:hypothetical protein HYC85_021580 [Camellia sinensis]|uniref:ABC1 atypical kinase-like domain-containing protein n=1 Tax=Camellia sinensis TaxID=4442 RepID=A0A7J7GI24_CAMSI|nr:hypothetical protein HYC85_021580 [Camellia sinensis]